MGRRKVTVKESVVERIAEIAWYIESKGLVATAEKFTDDIYDFILKLAESNGNWQWNRLQQRNYLAVSVAYTLAQ